MFPFTISTTLSTCRKIFTSLECITIFYLSLPLLIFFISWLNLIPSLICITLLSFSLILSVNFFLEPANSPAHSLKDILKQKHWIIILSIIGLLILWVTLSGSGRFFLQNGDYHKHNAVLNDLVTLEWPVAYKNIPQLDDPYQKENFYLTYYLGYYLPAAVIGKIFDNVYVANYFLYAWTIAGILLSFSWAYRIINSISISITLFIILFSGMDVIGLLFNLDPNSKNSESILKGGSHIEWWSGYGYWQYSSTTACLFWTPHHFIAAFILTLFLIYWFTNKTKDRDSEITYFSKPSTILFSPFPFLFSLSSFWSPFVMLGLVPFLPLALFNHSWKRLFHWQSLISPLIILLFFALYYQSNMMKHPQGFLWEFQSLFATWPRYLIFCFLEFGLYLLLILPSYKFGSKFDKTLFLIVTLSLFLIPFYRLGYYNDFAMRASLPGLIILQILIIKFIINFKDHALYPIKIGLFIALFFGSFTPLQEISRSLMYSDGYFEFTNLTKTFKGSQFLGREDSFFFDYLARKNANPPFIEVTRDNLNDLYNHQ